VSIRERQTMVATEKAIDRELRSGRPPSITAIQREVAYGFRDRPAGRPRFRPQRVMKNKVSDPKAYNQLFKAAAEDLSLVTDEVFGQGARMMALADYYELDKIRLSRELRRLRGRIAGLSERVSHRAIDATVFDSFTDFSQIEFVGEPGRNLMQTTAMVDLSGGEVTLDLMGKGHALVDLRMAAARSTVKGSYDTLQTQGHIENALNDHINEAWRQVVTRKDADTLSVLLSIELPEAKAANGLMIFTQMPKQAQAKVLISSDGETYRSIPITSTEQPLYWAFPSQTIKSLRVEIIKAAPDFTEGTQYQYHFGIQRISLRSSAYQAESRLVSGLLEVGSSMRQVTLTADQSLPPQTSIRYYVAEDRTGESLQWQEISTDKPLVISKPEIYEVFLAGPYGESGGIVNGIQLYQAGTLDDDFNAKTLQLQTGETMWEHTLRAAPGLLEGYSPSLVDFRDADPTESVSYVRLESNALPISVGVQRFVLEVYTPRERSESFLLTKSTGEATVYLNNEVLRPVSSVYTYRLKAGWNQITLLVATLDTGTITPRISFPDTSVRTFARSQMMRQVSIENLYYDVSRYDRGAYAVEGDAILLNYDPVAADLEGDGARYLATCEVPPLTSPADLRFMAILSRGMTVEDATPRLRSYRLQVQ
jgi:hypothetical protein